MNCYLVQPVQPLGNTYKERKKLPTQTKKQIDSKVKGLVLERIGRKKAGEWTALHPSAIAPRIMINLLAALAMPSFPGQTIELLPSSRQVKKPHLKRVFGKHIPVGLRRCEPHGWINAWMQFLLYIPKLPELFSFAPRRFEPFREFMDQYFADQQENRPVSFADSASLIRCLLQMLPFSLFKDPMRVDLFAIFRTFFKSVFAQISVSDSIVFHPEWQFLWDPSVSMLEGEIRKKMALDPPEILVAIQGENAVSCPVVQRQIFGLHHFYDLNAFIEHRSDGKNAASFVTYVKIDGSWYQCDDDRICALRSNNLSMPLHRSVLLHYKRFGFNKSNWIK